VAGDDETTLACLLIEEVGEEDTDIRGARVDQRLLVLDQVTGLHRVPDREGIGDEGGAGDGGDEPGDRPTR
jgi:hypothetical protein